MGRSRGGGGGGQEDGGRQHLSGRWRGWGGGRLRHLSTFCTNFPAPFSASTQRALQDAALPHPTSKARCFGSGERAREVDGSGASTLLPRKTQPSQPRRTQLQTSETCTHPRRKRRNRSFNF